METMKMKMTSNTSPSLLESIFSDTVFDNKNIYPFYLLFIY